MASVNKTILIGNLTRDVELKFTPKGTAIAQVGLALNHVYKTESGEKREEVTFVDVELWGKTAELAGQYLKKGSQVYFEGRLKMDSWDDKATGQKRSKLKIVADTMQFLGSKSDSQSAPAQQRKAAPVASRPPADPDLDGEDAPF